MKYITPEIEWVEFENVDIIQTSTTNPENPKEEGPTTGSDELPYG